MSKQYRNKLQWKKNLWQQLGIGFLSLSLACILSDYTASVVGHYKVPLLNWWTFGKFRYHEIGQQGLPQVYYSNLQRKEDNAVYISMYALTYYDLLRKRPENHYFLQYYYFEPEIFQLPEAQYQTRFLSCADWLVKNLQMRQERGGRRYGVWEYHFNWPPYNLKAPWVSGMAQGLGLQVLVRAYLLTKNKTYIDTARLAMNAFFVEVEDGGVTYKEDVGWWYEEYASEAAVRSKVLNGMQHAVIGISEYHSATKDAQSSILLQQGLSSLIAHVDRYEAGWWTYYDVLGNISSVKYHRVHVALNKQLYDISKNNKFKESAERWEQYQAPFFLREFIKQKPNSAEIIFLGLNFVIIWLILESLFLTRRRMSTKRHATL